MKLRSHGHRGVRVGALCGALLFAVSCTSGGHTVLGYATVKGVDGSRAQVSDGSAAQVSPDSATAIADDDTATEVSLSAEQLQAALVPRDERPDGRDTTGGALRIIDIPGFGRPSVVHSPAGWLALSWRKLGDSKAPSGVQSVLYRSVDAVHWVSIPLEQQDDLRLTHLMYGAGRYVMLGGAVGAAVVWTSLDAEHWSVTTLPPVSGAPVELAYVQRRFFVVGFNQLLVSDTGMDWKVVPFSLIQGGAAAYGNGAYLIAGSGPMETSADGWSWQEHALDCALPEACFDGTDHQQFHLPPLFAEGSFYSGALHSVDGATWEASNAPDPVAYASGHFFGVPTVEKGVSTWVRGGEVQTLRVSRPLQPVLGPYSPAGPGAHPIYEFPPPDEVDVEFADGLTCETASCLWLGGRGIEALVLVPPAGTPPLADHVARSVEGTPLLDYNCLSLGMVFCDDYQSRTGCVCNPDAPESPLFCVDPNQYQCEGQFTLAPDEWPLGDLRGGCWCGAMDSNSEGDR